MLLPLDLFNIIQRHDVNRYTAMDARGNPRLFASLDRLHEDDLRKVHGALTSGKAFLFF